MFLKATLLTILTLNVSGDYVGDIKKFREQFSSLRSSGSDVLKTLDDLVENGDKIISLTRPVGSLVAAGIDTIFQPDSDEQKAIAALHDYVVEQDDVSHLQRELEGSSMEPGYLEEVDTKLDIMMTVLDRVTDPDIPRNPFKDQFVQVCQGTYLPPLAHLVYIRNFFDKYCPLPTVADAKITARIFEEIGKVESRIEATRNFSSKYLAAKRKILAAVSLLSRLVSTRADTVLKRISTMSAATQDDMEADLIEIANDNALRNVAGSCYLKAANDAYAYERTPLLAVVEQVINDMLRIELLAMSCANITYGGDKEAIRKVESQMSTMIKQIAAYIALWVRTAQNLAWPVSIAAAKTALASISPELPPEKLNASASLVRQAFDSRGAESDFYQVLVLPNWAQDKWWSVRSPFNRTYSRFEYGNAVVHVFRYEEATAYHRAQNATKNFDSWRLHLHDILHFGRSSDTPGILLLLIRQLGKEPYYRSFVAIKNKAWFGMNAGIDHGQDFGAEGELAAVSTVDFYESHWYDDAYSWKFFAML